MHALESSVQVLETSLKQIKQLNLFQNVFTSFYSFISETEEIQLKAITSNKKEKFLDAKYHLPDACSLLRIIIPAVFTI